MSKDAILTIINLIQSSGSAVRESDLYALLPQAIEKQDFRKNLAELESSGELLRIDNLVIKNEQSVHERNQQISRKIYKDNYNYLKIFSRLPWVRFISLTGSNAFESCYRNDDIDLFVITTAERLWLVYLIIVILSKLLGKRPFFCFNYLVDEQSIALKQQSYHNAVQIYMMKPLFNGKYKKELYSQNPWIKTYLPNIPEGYEVDPFYRLRSDFKSRKTISRLLDKINERIYMRYKKRLTQKFPQSINKGIILDKGHAKLHHNDKSHMYDEMMAYETDTGSN